MTDLFVPPKLLADMIAAAIAGGRSFVVQHGTDGENPFVTFKSRWLPEGCDIPTDISITWHTRGTGTYRLFSATASGYYRAAHDITGRQAMRLLTGETCFHAADAA